MATAEAAGGDTERKGRGGVMAVFPPSAPLSATGVINRQGEGCPVMRERGTCDSGDNTAALLKPGEGKRLPTDSS